MIVQSSNKNMNDQIQGGGTDEQQKMALLQSLLREADQSGLGKVSQQQSLQGMDSNFFSLHSADQMLLQQRAIDNLAFGGMANSFQQQQRLPMQGPDDFMLLRQLQQQQLQLQQQQQLLLQAGGLAGGLTGTGLGGIGSSGFGGPSFGAGNSAASFLGSGSTAGNFSDNVFVAHGLSDASQQRNNNNMGSYNDMLSGTSASSGQSKTILSDSLPMSLPPSNQAHRRSESFPVTLFRILVDLEVAGAAAQVAHFVAGGDAFLIKNAKIFEDTIIPKYFPRMGSFGSFQRQLNLYDFKRISQGPHRGAYNHPLFRRSCPHLARQMKRTKIKGLRKNFKKEKDEQTQDVISDEQD